MPILTETGASVPDESDRPTKPGMYLVTLHGRTKLDEQMDGWGTAGPFIGPLKYFHTTYVTTIRIMFESEEDEALYFSDVAFPDPQELTLDRDMLLYNGVLYGDWTVFVAKPHDCVLPPDTFRQVLRP